MKLTNGTSPPQGNGVKKSYSQRQQETIRLIIQSLEDLGLEQSADALEKESGLALEAPAVSEFRSGVLVGDWEKVEASFDILDINASDLQAVKFLIREQKYLELLEAQDIKAALHVLRHELAPLKINAEQLHELSSYMMCPDFVTLKRKANWDGAAGSSRSKLLDRLQEYIHSAVMIPQHRLDTLIDQAIQSQKMNCLYHNVLDDNVSLFTDHSCERNRFPCLTTHIFEEHADEVWFLSFSHDGRYLASASKDMTAAIWNADDGQLVHVLAGHTNAISFLAWSPDDSMLLTGSNDTTLKLWDPRTGECTRTFSKHSDIVTACAWLPDGVRFVSGSVDKHIYVWNTDGDVVHKWSGVRVTDLAISRDGKILLAIFEKKIRMYNLEDYTEGSTIPESDSITSVNIADDCRHALVNLSTQEVHLWDLQEKSLVRKYTGQKQGRFVIRSCFGGLNQAFILSGSEDCCVYVWHRERGALIETLPGHSDCVNCVAWNPKRNMFASASDDHTIRLWGPPS
ncbi:hypothetical protein HDU85_005269 [Gaertneriomyces sp. JEL0708]|nr:hypothetical protein HDU85_005269 [Gaertneriomyces sp. JEL0708]